MLSDLRSKRGPDRAVGFAWYDEDIDMIDITEMYHSTDYCVPVFQPNPTS